MLSRELFQILFLSPVFAYALAVPSSSSKRAVPSQGFYDPRDNGGTWLTTVADTSPLGLSEPINAVILGTSDQAVLVDSSENGGLRNYFNSFDMASECLGQHSGNDQGANLGDGNGLLNETAVIRYDYGDASIGTCKESIEGGNHFRYWVQDGEAANSGAVFMAVSYELPSSQGHDIIFNGYNLGRDWLVGNITSQPSILPTSTFNSTSATSSLSTSNLTFSGQTTANGYVYLTTVTYVSGLLANGSDGINHFLSVGANGTSAVDGLVALMEVKMLETPQRLTSSASITHTPAWMLLSLVVPVLSLLC
ncbi:uncharacterized protein STEHIDRAFT_147412 [Stereum hirsutum FP-91666 SS1]|uniref:uncharacterized protein n=1 Tax=Stereum hirsutum (strain FP-91666) TaxID=721885 RepID=UPI000444A04C|nr:uncharacterized protein STEHIDRAFT_147412 [Stereum hirsutum FP-91666 SS1]EIM85776.1 hypothetical protein STEHIDRAFT_147412 [Stereum hirsutum FP-91666 SS1]